MATGKDTHLSANLEPVFQELLLDQQANPVSQCFQIDSDDDESNKKPYLSHIRRGLRKQRKQHA